MKTPQGLYIYMYTRTMFVYNEALRLRVPKGVTKLFSDRLTVAFARSWCALLELEALELRVNYIGAFRGLEI